MHLNFIPSLQEYLKKPSGYRFCLIYIFQLFPTVVTYYLIISLKTDISKHLPLFLNDCNISEVNSTNILGFTFDSTLTWQDHIVKVLTRGNQRLGQLHRCHSLITYPSCTSHGLGQQLNMDMFYILVQHHPILILYRQELNI